MSFINYSSREINCKIVYYGPGLCGKTTNLQYIYNKTNPEAKGKMISLATETERTLFFDFLPLSLGEIRGFKTRFHLYTVPGQVFYDASRKLILKGVDGVIFVADSQVERMDANVESVENLLVNLKSQGYDLLTIPYVLQLNKRDLPNVVPVDDMVRQLRRKDEPIFESTAIEKEIDKALRRRVWLKSGGYIVIDHTEALVAIDVNSGKYVGKRDFEETVLKINLEAVAEVVRQIRLRDLGGIIIIDFIDMDRSEHRDQVFKALLKVLADDRQGEWRVVVPAGWTNLAFFKLADANEAVIRQLLPDDETLEELFLRTVGT